MLLLLRAPLEHDRRDDARERIEHVRQAEAVLDQLGLEHDLVIHLEARAAVFLREHGEKPPLPAELVRESPTKAVLLLVLARRPRRRPTQMLAAAHVLGHPRGDFAAK